jgi:hypothetical protein
MPTADFTRKKEIPMNSVVRKFLATLGIVIVTIAFSTIAGAQCANINLDQLKSGHLQKQSFDGLGFGQPRLQTAGEDLDPVVGFWKVFFKIGTDTIDSPFVQWHSDGTEIMNSNRPPSTQSFCLGVWKRVAPFKYALNHYAISYNPDGTLLGVTNIRESVTLAKDGNHYTGSFTITQYDQAGNVLGGPSGDITAFRIKVDTVITHL